MAEPSSRISSGVGGRPTPYRGDCADRVAAARRIALSFHIRHGPVGADVPDLDAVVVVRGIGPASRNQGGPRRLYVAGFVDGARCDEGVPAVEPPRQPEARQRNRQPRLLQLRLDPGPYTVSRPLDPR